MTIGDVRKQIVPMLEDSNWAEKQLESMDSQFTRRAYVRSVFAMIEGTLWVLKQTVLNAQTGAGEARPFTLAEYALLSEITYSLKGNGEAREHPKYLRLPENLRFVFGVISKYFDPDLTLAVDTRAWEDFLAAHSVRNRITHPKTPDEFNISDLEIAVCKRTTAWFYKLVLEIFDSLTKGSDEPYGR